MDMLSRQQNSLHVNMRRADGEYRLHVEYSLAYLSEGAPPYHFEHLEVVPVETHVFYSGGKWLHCRETGKESKKILTLFNHRQSTSIVLFFHTAEKQSIDRATVHIHLPNDLMSFQYSHIYSQWRSSCFGYKKLNSCIPMLNDGCMLGK